MIAQSHTSRTQPLALAAIRVSPLSVRRNGDQPINCTVGIAPPSSSARCRPVLLAGYTLSAACLRTWPYLFVSAALVVPPLYPSLLGGETPVYVANLVFVAGCFAVLARRTDFQIGEDSVGKAAAGFLFALALSIPFGFWLSGTSEGLGSCLRFFLLLHPFLIYYWLRGFRPVHREEWLIPAGKLLLGLGAASAIYGIVDFYFPIPIPHPFADQYIYLDGRMIRRAQGMLYEASSFGNLSAFFLSLTLAILLSWWQKLSTALEGDAVSDGRHIYDGAFLVLLTRQLGQRAGHDGGIPDTAAKTEVQTRSSIDPGRAGVRVSGLSDVTPRRAQLLQLENGDPSGVLE